MYPIVQQDLHLCPLTSSQSHGIGTVQVTHKSVFFLNKIPACQGDRVICQDGSQAIIQANKSCVNIQGQRLACSADQSSHNGKLVPSIQQIFIQKAAVFIEIGSHLEIGANVYFGY